MLQVFFWCLPRASYKMTHHFIDALGSHTFLYLLFRKKEERNDNSSTTRAPKPVPLLIYCQVKHFVFGAATPRNQKQNFNLFKNLYSFFLKLLHKISNQSLIPENHHFRPPMFMCLRTQSLRKHYSISPEIRARDQTEYPY